MLQRSKKNFLLWLLPFLLIIVAFLVYLPLSSYAGIPVLNYHKVNDEDFNALTINSREFDAQMAYLKKAGYNSVTPKQLLDYWENGTMLPNNPILITFDDGYEDNYRVAYPILQKYNLAATIFIITDFPDNDRHYLTWNQIKEMHSNNINFASHTLSHTILTNEPDESLEAQLTKSKEALEYRLGQKVDFLAYPGGYYNKHVIEKVKAAGYKGAFTINFGRSNKQPNLYSLNRIPIFTSTSNTHLHFWLRLKLTQELLALENFKKTLHNAGATKIASWIPSI